MAMKNNLYVCMYVCMRYVCNGCVDLEASHARIICCFKGLKVARMQRSTFHVLLDGRCFHLFPGCRLGTPMLFGSAPVLPLVSLVLFWSSIRNVSCTLPVVRMSPFLHHPLIWIHRCLPSENTWWKPFCIFFVPVLQLYYILLWRKCRLSRTLSLMCFYYESKRLANNSSFVFLPTVLYVWKALHWIRVWGLTKSLRPLHRPTDTPLSGEIQASPTMKCFWAQSLF